MTRSKKHRDGWMAEVSKVYTTIVEHEGLRTQIVPRSHTVLRAQSLGYAFACLRAKISA